MGNKTKFFVDIQDLHSEVTGSCHLVVVRMPNRDRIKFVVDCGLFQEEKYEKYNEHFQFNPEDLDFVLLTHNHADHNGRIPLLYKKGFLGKVYCTEETEKLAKLSYIDMAKVFAVTAKRRHEKPLYDESDVTIALNNHIGVPYEKKISPHPNIDFYLLKNGHLVGAAMILARIKCYGFKDINLLFTGDYRKDNMFEEIPDIPLWIKELPLTIIQESTYGNIVSNNIKSNFYDNIIRATKENKIILLPVFSQGRGQEIQFIIKKMMDSSLIPKDYPIWIDGKLLFKYNDFYEKYGKKNFYEEAKKFIPITAKYISDSIRDSICSDKNRKIIITTSGMGSYGPIQAYMPKLLEKRNVLIHFTGYCAEGTLGRILKETPQDELVNVSGIMLKKYAEVEYTSEFSAHAKADEMIDFLKQFSNLKTVLINHGEKDSKIDFAKMVIEEIKPSKGVGILDRNLFFRIDPYGMVKSFYTKFI